MSDIWHTVDEAPKPYEDIAFYVDGYLYFASYQPQYNQYGIFGADKVEKWCYVKELSSYILALETGLDRTRKALDVAVEELTKIKVDAESVGIGFFMTAAIFALAKIKTALEQKDK